MGSSERHAWLVAYDVANPRRLARVAKATERRAIRMQYSVFLGVWDTAGAEEALGAIAKEIHAKKDDLRAYRLPDRCEAEISGRPPACGEVVLSGRGFGLLGQLQEEGAIVISEGVLEEE